MLLNYTISYILNIWLLIWIFFKGFNVNYWIDFLFGDIKLGRFSFRYFHGN